MDDFAELEAFFANQEAAKWQPRYEWERMRGGPTEGAFSDPERNLFLRHIDGYDVHLHVYGGLDGDLWFVRADGKDAGYNLTSENFFEDGAALKKVEPAVLDKALALLDSCGLRDLRMHSLSEGRSRLDKCKCTYVPQREQYHDASNQAQA